MRYMLILNACIRLFDNIGFVIKMKLSSLCMLSCFKNSLKIFQEHLQRLSANNKCHRLQIGSSRVYSDRQLNSDMDLVCLVFQILE